MKKIKSNKGITISTLIITIIVMLILTTVTITSTYIGADFKAYNLMCADIKMLEDKILYFYREYGELPIGSKVTNLPEEIDNGHVFYEINMNLLSNITLNFGADEDVYIVDSETFEVYYLKGIEYDDKIYYTDTPVEISEDDTQDDIQEDTQEDIIGVDGEVFSPIYPETKPYTDENGDTAIVPKGFSVGKSKGIDTIDNGLVIQDEEGNQFVWIPVSKAIVTEAEIAQIIKNSETTENPIDNEVDAVQSLVDSGTYPMAMQVGTDYIGILYNFTHNEDNTLTLSVIERNSTSYREPANLEGEKTFSEGTTVNGTTFEVETKYQYDSQEMFTLYGGGTFTKTLYQEAFNKMVKSVEDNGGFYVGRYEISNDDNLAYAETKKDKTAWANKTWYEMYKLEKAYAEKNAGLGVTSEMIWGAQWDQMMIFVNGKDDGISTTENPSKFYVAKTGNRYSGVTAIKTGMNDKGDEVANIFDLEASRVEWTQEAISSTIRVIRGRSYCQKL